MRTESDQIAKRTIQLALENHGDTVVQQEVSAPDPQYIDLWHTPVFALTLPPAWLALIFRMAAEPCMWEPFSAAVRPTQLRDNQRKQLVWHHQLCQEARRKDAPPPQLPFLWLLSPGHPARLFEEHDVLPLPGWPAGFHHFGRGFRIGLLLLHELPAGVETLILRLLGGERTRREALAELERLGDRDERRALRTFVVELRQRVAHDKEIDEADREAFMTAVQAEFQRFQQDLIEKGQEQGIEQGLRRAARMVCQSSGIELTEQRAALLEAMDAPALSTLLGQLMAQKRWPE